MLEIINGIRDIGRLGSEYYSDRMKEFIMTLRAGNTAVERGKIPLVSFFNDKTRSVDRIPGQKIPVEEYNVYFTDGSYTDNGYGFSKYVSNFVMPMNHGLTVLVYQYSVQEILDARANRIDLEKQMIESLKAVMRVYTQQILPYKLINTLLTGTDLSVSIPTEATATSDDKYVRAFGWLRGENIEAYKKGHIQVTHACHYRGTKGRTFALSDIDDATDTLGMYKDSSPAKPYAFANSRTIRNTVASVTEYEKNRDDQLVFGIKYREALGVKWIDVDTYLPEGIILFVDADVRDLIIKAESMDVAQRGIGLIKDFGGQQTKLESAEDLNGGKVFVFPSEQLIVRRHQGLILDTTNQGKTELGKEGWADTATVNKIEDFCKNLLKSYYREMK